MASATPARHGPDTSARTHRHAGGARGGERSIERATLLHRERTHAASIIPGSPGHRPPRAGVSRPGVVPRRVGRPTDPSRREGPTVPPMTRRSPRTHLPSPRPSSQRPSPRAHSCRPVIHRGQSAPRLVAFANRRSHMSQCGRTSSAIAVSTRAGGRGRDQHRDRTLLVGPTEPAQLVAGVEARRRRAGARPARDRARRAARRGPGADGLGAGCGEPAARAPRPGRGRGRPPCASSATGRRCSSPSSASATAARCRTPSARTDAAIEQARDGFADGESGRDAATARRAGRGRLRTVVRAARRRRRLGAR